MSLPIVHCHNSLCCHFPLLQALPPGKILRNTTGYERFQLTRMREAVKLASVFNKYSCSLPIITGVHQRGQREDDVQGWRRSARGSLGYYLMRSWKSARARRGWVMPTMRKGKIYRSTAVEDPPECGDIQSSLTNDNIKAIILVRFL